MTMLIGQFCRPFLPFCNDIKKEALWQTSLKGCIKCSFTLISLTEKLHLFPSVPFLFGRLLLESLPMQVWEMHSSSCRSNGCGCHSANFNFFPLQENLVIHVILFAHTIIS